LLTVKVRQKSLLTVILIVAALVLGGCQTFRGMKQDAGFIGDKTREVWDDAFSQNPQ